MKIYPLILFVGWLTVASELILSAQEVSLAEALDTSGINWQATAGQLGEPDPENPLVLVDENYWHGVTDESWDGEDALYVKMQAGQSSYTSLTATFQAPVQISWWYKVSEDSDAHLHYFSTEYTPKADFDYAFGSLEGDGAWKHVTETIRDTTSFKLSINVNSFGGKVEEIWMDNFQAKTVFPPEIVEFPQTVGALLGKQTTINVEAKAVGNVSYKWYRNDIEVPGETEASIIIPAENEVGEAQYKVEVTDSLGSITSPPATVRFFDINEALDNDDLVFEIEDSLSGSYTEMAVTGEDAYDGEDAIYLEKLGQLRDPKYHLTSRSISTQIQGSTILKFRYRGIIAVRLNGENPNFSYHAYNYSEEDGDWTIAYVPIPDGNTEVEFSATSYFYSKSGSGVLDQIELVTQPKVFFNATNYARLNGNDIPIHYTFITAGNTTHQLIKGETVVASSENERVTLPTAEVSDTGVYRVRIVNEFEEEAFSNEFEIQVYDSYLGDALDQPDLIWTTVGQDPWIPQNYQTYDGEDAVERVPWITPAPNYFPSELQIEYDSQPPKLQTIIPGPAYLSFWWRGGFFEANDREVWLGESDRSKWSKASLLLTATTNTLSWDTTYLDRVQIEYLDEDPFRFWAFSRYDSGTVLNNFSSILEGDDDFDGWSNFLEWALNKNLNFPNGTQSYEFIEVDGELYLGITFSRRGDLGQYIVYLEASDDMDSWEKIDSVVSETYHESNDTYTITIRIPSRSVKAVGLFDSW